MEGNVVPSCLSEPETCRTQAAAFLHVSCTMAYRSQALRACVRSQITCHYLVGLFIYFFVFFNRVPQIILEQHEVLIIQIVGVVYK
jgi:hypothetical protein